MARRICRTSKGRFKKCGGGGSKKRAGCKHGRTKAGTCRKRPKRRR